MSGLCTAINPSARYSGGGSADIAGAGAVAVVVVELDVVDINAVGRHCLELGPTPTCEASIALFIVVVNADTPRKRMLIRLWRMTTYVKASGDFIATNRVRSFVGAN